MDNLLADIATVDDDLLVSTRYGFAYQIRQDELVSYDESYFNKCAGYEGQEIAQKINRGRVELVAKHYSPIDPVLDIGIGSGEFIKNRPNTWGTDVNPVAVKWLQEQGKHATDLSQFQAFTFWDVLEHVPTPADYFSQMPKGSHLFTSIPIFADITKVRESKHYRPGEHLYYFDEPGFIRWMGMHNFLFLERQSFEMDAGRDSIYSFAFYKTR